MGEWTFFSNYGHVLVCLERNNRARLRDVAEAVGITERAVQKIVKDLEQAGYITIRKQGRCNRYRINRRKSLRHGLESHVSVSRLLALVAPAGRASAVAVAPSEEAESETDETPRDAAMPAAVEPAPDTASIPAPEPYPEAEQSVAENESAFAAPPETEVEPEPESEEKAKEKSNKRKKGSEPLDLEQQGSLF